MAKKSSRDTRVANRWNHGFDDRRNVSATPTLATRRSRSAIGSTTPLLVASAPSRYVAIAETSVVTP